MDRNSTTPVTEHARATSDAMANTLNAAVLSNVGTPVSSWTPPGTVVEVAKATVAIRAATTEQDSEGCSGNDPRRIVTKLGRQVQRTVAFMELIQVWLPVLYSQQHYVLLVAIHVMHCYWKHFQDSLHHFYYPIPCCY
ncbi:hypothetical protein Ahy_B10g100561 [Arachis hypogaea]|uniref:Uncharacterized protein n=1 Tax=Arachis hypogaea TaxID=3818 RepID=A0A444WX55_ARAHY|nr:hypothetical protein Ahy_B10g100561 [Arachis hypogaea]